ncbi:hypothetical protein [Hwanghaeella sp.]|uniref:hypothetical protein n=1 Tax=Hwanghaeella sp. TaxID=2605943 RepID=UPI003CCBD332
MKHTVTHDITVKFDDGVRVSLESGELIVSANTAGFVSLTAAHLEALNKRFAICGDQIVPALTQLEIIDGGAA